MSRTARAAAIALALAWGASSVGSTGALRRPQTPATFKACDVVALTGLDIQGTAIREATVVPPGGGAPPRASSRLPSLPAFCRVRGSVAPEQDSLINFEVWVPDAWNGKIVVTGNGGYGNALSTRDMTNALAQGYAAAGGDTGHQTPTPDDLMWGVGHPERILDWGTRSIHAITGPARLIASAVAGKPVRRAYYYGCSTGGHQGYAEIQRYPQDFDGVIAGAPGNNRVRLNAGFLWQYLANHRRDDASQPIIPASKLPLITQAVVAACDANDGLTDGVVDDPRTCRYDPAVLLCKTDDRPDCLTREQLDALERMYAGARNPPTGEQVYPGWPKSSEALTVMPDGRPGSGWHQYWGTSEPARANFWRYWVFENPAWDWWSFDFDRHLALADQKVGRLVDQTNPDISGFRTHGGKAIVYQGWQDPVVNALDTIAYYERVRARTGSQAETDRFFRLFLVGGMGHCGGGTGATNFGNQGGSAPVTDADHDLLAALDRWVEQGMAPERIVASRVVNGETVRTRPLCPYPQKAVYTGRGSPDDAASFVCR
jgi:feruloyl esterase